MRAEIQRRLAEALQGQVTWQTLELRLLPYPHAGLRELRVDIPEKVNVTAEALTVDLRFWPLLRGSVQVSSVTLEKPAIRILAKGGEPQAAPDALQLYRAAMEPTVRALQEFAPDMTLRMAHGAVDRFTDVNLNTRTSATGVNFELSASSAFWKRLAVDGRIAYADLAAHARIAVDGLIVDADVPAARLRAELRTDGKSLIECDFDAGVGSVGTVKGKLALPAGQFVAQFDALDLAQALDIARRKMPNLQAIESAEGRISASVDARIGPPWQARIDLIKSSAALKLAALPWKVSAQAARVTLTDKLVHVAGAKGAVGDSPYSDTEAQIELTAPMRLSAAAGKATLKLEQWFPWLRTKAPLDDLSSLSGIAEVALKSLALRFDRPAEAKFDAVVTLRKVSAGLKALPEQLHLEGGTIRADPKGVRLAGLAGAIGASTFAGVDAEIALGKTPRLAAASGRATFKLEQWFAWLRTKAPLDDIASLSGSVDLGLNRLAMRFDRPQDVDFDAVVTPLKVSAELKMLPAPVSVNGGSIGATRDQVRFAGVSAGMLDARASVSGSFSLKSSALELSLADGLTGEQLLRWALERAELPSRLEPRTPLRFAAQRIAWAPKRPLEVDARLDFEGGPAVGLALAWQPERLELKRVAIKDAGSDATLSATIAAKQVQGGFSGTLQGRSLAALLRGRPPQVSGIARGKLRFTMDRAQPARSVAEGTLRVEALDLSWLAGKRAIVEAIDLSADNAGVRIANAALDLEGQHFRLSGTVQRTDAHPVIDARLESPGVDLVRLLPPPRARKPDEKATAVWPLPVRGRIEVHSAFIEHSRYRVEPFAGILSLEPERARLEVKEARMCGVSFPLELEATPQDATLDIHLAMKDQPFEKSLHCLTGGTVEITGNADLRAELHTRGHRPHLLRDLTGTAQLALRDGRVRKFALLGNILSVRNIGSVKRMHEEGFPFRTLHARGSFESGAFLVDEAAFDSDALNLAATGQVDLLGANSRLTVLVGLLAGLDRVAGAIPIVGDIFGGSLTALPVEVSGDIRDPLVVPLGPRAVSKRLLEILGNTAKVPGKLMVPKEAAP